MHMLPLANKACILISGILKVAMYYIQMSSGLILFSCPDSRSLIRFPKHQQDT